MHHQSIDTVLTVRKDLNRRTCIRVAMYYDNILHDYIIKDTWFEFYIDFYTIARHAGRHR